MESKFMYTNTIDHAPPEIKDKIKKKLRDKVAKYKEEVETERYKTAIEKLVEKHGKEAVFKTGYKSPEYKKPIVLKKVKLNILGDDYEFYTEEYVDGKYDFRGMKTEELDSYLLGYDLIDVALASVYQIPLQSLNIARENVANKRTEKPALKLSFFKSGTEFSEKYMDEIYKYFEELDNHIKNLEKPVED